jgi:hypothetical protein
MPNTKEEAIWIETFTGKKVNPYRLQLDDIDIRDIAHSLSLLCRFVGHCNIFYSVAQHSLHVSDLVFHELGQQVVEDVRFASRTCLAALLHDGAEAYISDISRPVKYSIREFGELERRISGKIMQKFGCVGADWTLIKKMDSKMLASEALYLMHSKGEGWYLPEPPITCTISSHTPEAIEHLFLERFHTIRGKQPL